MSATRTSAPTRFTVSPLPKGHPDRATHAVHVEHRPEGHGWAITHPEKGVLTRRGEWAPEPDTTNMTPRQVRDYRLPFVAAMRRARETVNTLHPTT